MKYNKLIRDNIPEIIKNNGKECTIEVLNNEKYIYYLEEKLKEEMAEYFESKDVEELTDLVEVAYALAKAKGYTTEQFNDMRQEKCRKNGAFEKRLLLKEVTEDGEEV